MFSWCMVGQVGPPEYLVVIWYHAFGTLGIQTNKINLELGFIIILEWKRKSDLIILFA